MVLFRILLFLFIIVSPFLSHASDISLEKDLQNALEKSKTILKKAERKLKAGSPVTDEINQLKTLSEDIKVSHLLLQERFRLRQQRANSLGPKAVERHQKMSEGYREALDEYLNLIESLPSESDQEDSGQQSAVSDQQIIIDKLKALLNKIIYKKKRPILGSLPYKNLNYPSREPISEPSIKPAYKVSHKIATCVKS